VTHRATTKRAVAVLTALLLILGGAGVAGCGPPDPIGSLLVGKMLDGLADQVQETVNSAGVEASGLITQTGSQVQQVIDQARVAFESSLGVAVDKVDQATHERLQEIDVMVKDFAADAFLKATAIQSQAQQLVLTLPIANGQPQVRAWTPHFVTGRETVSVVVDGIFTQAQQSGSEPRLQIGGTTVAPNSGANTTQQLIFIVPATVFPAARPDAVTPVSAALTVPFRSPILRQDKTAAYRLLLGLLPPSPGQIRVTRMVHERRLEQQPLTSKMYHQQGNEDGTSPNDGNVLGTYCTDALPLEPARRVEQRGERPQQPDQTMRERLDEVVQQRLDRRLAQWRHRFSFGVDDPDHARPTDVDHRSADGPPVGRAQGDRPAVR